MSDSGLSGFVTDRKEASSNFDPANRIIAVEGTLSDFPKIMPNKSGSRGRVVFTLNPLSEVVRAGDKQDEPGNYKNGFPVSFDYGEWDGRNRTAKTPRANDIWFEVIVPQFAKAGIDLGDVEQLKSLVGTTLRFEEREVERIGYQGEPYEARARDKETNNVLPPVEVDAAGNIVTDAEGNPIELEPDAEGNFPQDATYRKEIAWYSGLLPVPLGAASESGGAAAPAVEGNAAEVAEALFDQHKDDYDSFRLAAADNATIASDPALRNSILTGAYQPA